MIVATQLQTVTYQRDSRGLVTVRTLPNGVRSTCSYDSLSRTTVIEHRRSDTTLLFRLAYQYDAVGNPTSETSQRWDIGLGATVPYDLQYRYNARHELTGEKYFKNGVFILDLDYTHDAGGNRTRKVITDPTAPNSPVTIDSTYRADNQIASALRTAPLDPPQTTTYAEDANGNMTQEVAPTGTTNYSYNFEDKLLRVDLPAGSNVQFRNNFAGFRVEKTGTTGAVTRYVLDNLQAVLEKDAMGATQVRYVPGLARVVGSGIRYYLEDRLGSLVALVDSTQTVTDTFRCDAWGNLLAQQGSTSTSYQWVGNEAYYLTSDVGLFLLGLRFYSPTLGRFITRDPIGFQSGDWNQYRYVFNRPIVLIDPNGLSCAGDCFTTCGITCAFLCTLCVIAAIAGGCVAIPTTLGAATPVIAGLVAACIGAGGATCFAVCWLTYC